MGLFFTKPPALIDGDTAFADDVNVVSDRTDAGFILVEAAVSDWEPVISAFTDKAEEWAENPEDTEVDPGQYSALHWAAKALDQAAIATSAASTATTQANTAIVQAGIATTQANNASASASTATTQAGIATTQANIILNAISDLLIITPPTIYTPDWTGSISDPTIGNGSLIGEYLVSTTQAAAVINLLIGSTTTLGSGTWRFSLPATPSPISSAAQVFPVLLVNSGSTQIIGMASVIPGQNYLEILVPGGIGSVSPTSPWIWTTGDEIRMSFTYNI